MTETIILSMAYWILTPKIIDGLVRPTNKGSVASCPDIIFSLKMILWYNAYMPSLIEIDQANQTYNIKEGNDLLRRG